MSDKLRQAAERRRRLKAGKPGFGEGWMAMSDAEKLADAYIAELDDCAPIWWRGNDAGVRAICEKVNAILDGKDNGSGVAGEPWESTRRRLLAMVAEHPADDGQGAAS